jgi:hypothetical protein
LCIFFVVVVVVIVVIVVYQPFNYYSEATRAQLLVYKIVGYEKGAKKKIEKQTVMTR